MSTYIRKAQSQDVAALTELLRSLGWFAYMASESSEMTRERIIHHLTLCSADESHTIYVAEEDSRIVGYVAVHWLPYLFLPAPEGYISELFVCESARGQGIGTQLLEVVKAEAQERGCSRLMLVNSRSRDSYKHKFYERQGWKEREEIANFVYVLE
ncbi:MAG: GNAT family N-acetyltransferase [Pegethrix bostrychoides GSE-TBD4-15B]|jgi:GNAT superfamily N-acetyltransferase|uniref:GNAT family N-acetyltransferase n=1 Tax=Pegethrix bostrychoides GSE-TBD4-15B TaxID=2839662 RepID=A0A951PCI9_9CYAN|nr:GNAT family N-acetyltransferase [Pegethrix bostrychoides GSE-TBD4-15B]